MSLENVQQDWAIWLAALALGLIPGLFFFCGSQLLLKGKSAIAFKAMVLLFLAVGIARYFVSGDKWTDYLVFAVPAYQYFLLSRSAIRFEQREGMQVTGVYASTRKLLRASVAMQRFNWMYFLFGFALPLIIFSQSVV